MKNVNLIVSAILQLLLVLPASSHSALAVEPQDTAVSSGRGRLRVRVVGFRNGDGALSVAVFTVARGFPGKFERALTKASVPAVFPEQMVIFDDIPFGTCAVAIRHDENGNGKLDTNFIGMPEEGMGASNNPRPKFGPPSFDDASFLFDHDDVEVTVRLRYL